MVQIGWSRRAFFHSVNWIEFVLGPLTVIFGLLGKVSPATYANWPAPAAATMEWCQNNSLLIFVLIGSCSLFGWILRRCADPWYWDKLQALLDKFQEVAYEKFKDQIKDYHRVTLFRYRKFYWNISPGGQPCSWRGGRLPWSGWLVPVLRSGKTSKRTRAAFLAPDNGHRAEGIGGRAWVTNNITFVNGLPAIEPGCSRTKQKKYAKETNCSPTMVQGYLEQGRPLPRAIGAIPIEVKGRSWGVLVLDSADDQGVTGEMLTNFKVAMLSISQLLEKVK